MATVNKNFRIKHGLVVEGTTGTINGENILTETGSDQYILDLVGGANLIDSVNSTQLEIVDGELSVKSGVFDADGAAADAESNANTYTDNAINALDTDDIEEGSTNQYFTQSRARGSISAGNAISYDNTSGVIAVDASQLDSDDISEGTTNLYFTNDRARTAVTGIVAEGITTDNNGPGGATRIIADTTILATKTYADQAETDANTYTDTQLNSYTPTSSLDSTIDGYGYLKSADLSGYATESYVNTAVDNLVDGAPGLLDTLNEIAAAIANDENYATTMTTALAGKQDELTAGSNIDITNDIISVTGLDTDDVSEGSNLYFTTGRVDSHLSGGDGITYSSGTISADVAGGLEITGGQIVIDRDTTDSWYDASGAASTAESNANTYAEGLVDNLTDGTTSFTEINVNSEAKQIAATSTSLGSVAVTAYQWAKADFRSGKFLVKIDNGTHNEISEVLLTLDSSDNIAVTEYATVGTNGARGTITADISGTNVRVRVTPVNDSTIKITGTLLK
jgi:hypothetical protein